MIKITEQEAALLSEFTGTNMGTTIDWNTLMPVVKRVNEEIPCSKVEEIHDFYDSFHYGLYEADIKSVYSTVLQFIQWFNTQNTTK